MYIYIYIYLYLYTQNPTKLLLESNMLVLCRLKSLLKQNPGGMRPFYRLPS